MRISEIIASLIPKVRPVGPSRDVNQTPPTGGQYKKPDAVELSGESQLLSRLQTELRSMPEIDSAKVAELRAKIDAGDYSPTAKDIAQKIIGSGKE